MRIKSNTKIADRSIRDESSGRGVISQSCGRVCQSAQTVQNVQFHIGRFAFLLFNL